MATRARLYTPALKNFHKNERLPSTLPLVLPMTCYSHPHNRVRKANSVIALVRSFGECPLALHARTHLHLQHFL